MDNYTTRTAALKTVTIDARLGNFNNLSTKKLVINGQNVQDMIQNGGFDFKNDWRKLIINPRTQTCLKQLQLYGNGYKIIDSSGVLIFSNFEQKLQDCSDFYHNLQIPLTCDGVYTTNLDKLTNGNCMFRLCDNLIKFETNLPNIITGEQMFAGCQYLQSVKSDMPKLTNGYNMFSKTTHNGQSYRCSLRQFQGDLSSLVDGHNMFYMISGWYDSQLKREPGMYSFKSNTPLLENGNSMFCYSVLQVFDSSLESLSDGYNMFKSCILDKESVLRILNSLKQKNKNSGTLTLGIHEKFKTDTELIAALGGTESNQTLTTNAGKTWSLQIQWNA